MTGAPIEAVREGVTMLARSLAMEPDTREKVWISVIRFNSDAEQACPLTDVARFVEPTLVATGTTELGRALRKLGECIDAEVRKRSVDQRGDYKPVIYLLTDGRPTDNDWEAAARDLRTRSIGDFVACAAGPDADTAPLRAIADAVVRLQDSSAESLRSFLRWISQSVEVRSRAVESRSVHEDRPALPDGAELIEGNDEPEDLVP
jgi:uncharacterized protein YegL